MAQTIRKIYLHWSATHYNWADSGHYHTVILGSGQVKRLTGYEQPLTKHTFARNANSIAICLACMGGRGWADYPPTPKQIESLCKEVALLAVRLGWKSDEITVKRVLTHAEAAANRDYPIDTARKVSGWSLPTSTPQGKIYSVKARSLGLPHENYGPAYWQDGWPGGFVERWDLWQLKASDAPGSGGGILRQKIREYLKVATKPEVEFPTPGAATPKTLRKCPIYSGNKQIGTAFVLQDQRSYAKLGELAKAYGLGATWNNDYRYANLMAANVQAKYLADAPLMMGFPAVDVYLNRPQDEDGTPIDDAEYPVRPMLQGILINGSTHVLVAEFAQELGISLKVDRDMTLRMGPLPASIALPDADPESPQLQRDGR
jgi:hypothetical protein